MKVVSTDHSQANNLRSMIFYFFKQQIFFSVVNIKTIISFDDLFLIRNFIYFFFSLLTRSPFIYLGAWRTSSFLRLLIKYNALQSPCYLFAFLVEAFPEYQRIRSKANFKDQFFLVYILFLQSYSEGEFQREYLISVATCLFAYH